MYPDRQSVERPGKEDRPDGDGEHLAGAEPGTAETETGRPHTDEETFSFDAGADEPPD